MAELREVGAILDTGKIEEEELQSALQGLLFHQCLYEDWPYPPAYRIIARQGDPPAICRVRNQLRRTGTGRDGEFASLHSNSHLVCLQCVVGCHCRF